MTTLILYAILSAAMFYLGSRALITQWIWRRYPPRFARFMDCAACTGFWWGLFWAMVLGPVYHLDVMGMSWRAVTTPIVVGLCTLVLTPVVAALMDYGLAMLGSTVPPDEKG